MRCNQVSIFIERFGRYVPKNYPADVQRIGVYCDDSTSIYAALSKAYACAINELNEYDHIGARCDVSTNEFSHVDYREMYGTLPIEKRSYEQDFQYCVTSRVLHEDFLWVYEHKAEILKALEKCESESDLIPCLKEEFGLNDVQIRKLSQIRLEMLTKERYEETKGRLQKLKEKDEEFKKRKAANELPKEFIFDEMDYYRRCIRKYKEEIELIEGYFKAVDNYREVIDTIMNTDDNREYSDLMEGKFGFTARQSRALRYCCANDFSRAEQEKKRNKLEELKKDIKDCEDKLLP